MATILRCWGKKFTPCQCWDIQQLWSSHFCAHTHLDAPPPCRLFSLRAGTPQTPDQQWNVSALAGSKAPAGSLTSPDRNPIKPLWGDQSETVCLCECAKRCNGGGDWTILHLDKWSEEECGAHKCTHTHTGTWCLSFTELPGQMFYECKLNEHQVLLFKQHATVQL